MKINFLTDVYENPLPQLKSRQAAFPSVAETGDGTLVCCFTIGEAFESVDGTAYISLSEDGGKTWSEPRGIIDKIGEKNGKTRVTDYCKVTSLGGDRLVCFGYAFPRTDENLPLGNPATGGLLDDFVFCMFSEDKGRTWTDYRKIPSPRGNSTEASAPITVLQNGDWVSPITGFSDWEGKSTGKICGRLLRSCDGGKTWNGDTVCTDFHSEDITCYEQRMCQLETGEIVVISWNENVKTGERLPNHYTVSIDNGKTFSCPESTGVMGQASGVCAVGGNRILALHARRRDTDTPGIYGYLVRVENGKWIIEKEDLLWQPNVPVSRDKSFAEIFAYLKFGQPSAVKLKNGKLLLTFWYAENGTYKVAVGEIEL